MSSLCINYLSARFKRYL